MFNIFILIEENKKELRIMKCDLNLSCKLKTQLMGENVKFEVLECKGIY